MHNTLLMIPLLWLGVGLASPADADQSMFYGGCVDASGTPVIAQLAPDQAVAVQSVSGTDGAVIRYNPAVVPKLGEAGHLFLFAHECARLNLGMAPGEPRNRDDSRRADCWAGSSLLRSGLMSLDDLGDLQARFSGLGAAEWSLLPGPPRRIDLLSCPRHLSPSLSAPAFGQETWNACARRCGDALYACQYGSGSSSKAQCETRHEACMAGCETGPDAR